MNKQLIIGIDLSFNSTGITMCELHNNEGKKMEFHRLIFDDESNKIKKYVPTYIKNINQSTYKLPSNISALEIVNDESDFYSEDQAGITLKAMVACKRIVKIIVEKIIKINQNPINLYINIEGFIMPQIQGAVQFRGLTGLIMLQGMLRSELIKLKLTEELKIDIFKIFITSPSDLKSWFSTNGSADKQVMLNAFNEIYDGKKLLPDTSSLAKVNDVIDSFALMMYCVSKIYGIKYESKSDSKILKHKLKSKSKNKIKNTSNIIKDSIIEII